MILLEQKLFILICLLLRSWEIIMNKKHIFLSVLILTLCMGADANPNLNNSNAVANIIAADSSSNSASQNNGNPTADSYSDNYLYFNLGEVGPYNGNFFTLSSPTSFSITNWNDWGGYGQTSNGIIVYANRHGSSVNADWLINQCNSDNCYGGMMYYGSGLVPFYDNFNFALIGNLSFEYKPTEKNYVCSNVAIAQYANTDRNDWILFSNIKPGLAVDSMYAEGYGNSPAGTTNPVDITCINQATQTPELFSVAGIGEAQDDEFVLSQVPFTESAGVLTDTEFGDEVIAAYNSATLANKLELFSNTDGASGTNFYAYAPGTPSYTFGPESSAESGNTIIESGTPLYVGQTTLTNDTGTQQTFSTQAYSKTITNSVTTTTTNTVGGSLSAEWGTGGAVDLIFANKLTITANYSHAWQHATTTSQSNTYTAPPQAVFIPAYSQASVTVVLNSVQFSGEYQFWRPMASGSMLPMSGMLFNTDNITSLSGWIPIYTSLLDATTKNVDSQVKINPTTQQVTLYGAGIFNGQAGTKMMVNVTISPLGGDSSAEKPKTYSYTIDPIIN